MSNYQQLKRTAVSTGGGYLDTGIIVPWSAASVPVGFLRCDGAAVDRTTYADLFAVIGEEYGVGDGVSTFNVPDLRAKQIYGDDDSTYVVAGTGGSATSTGNIAVTDNRGFSLNLSGVNTAAANVAIPAHTHYTFADLSTLATTSDTALGNNAPFRTAPSTGADFAYAMVGSNVGANGGLSSSAGSGNGSHSHGFSVSSNNAVSFSGGSIGATMNAVSTISPYVVCRFIIKT